MIKYEQTKANHAIVKKERKKEKTYMNYGDQQVTRN